MVRANLLTRLVGTVAHMEESENEAASARRSHSLEGAGSSQVGVEGAMRARDVSRPRAEHIRRALAAPPPVARVRQSPSIASGNGGSSPVSS